MGGERRGPGQEQVGGSSSPGTTPARPPGASSSGVSGSRSSRFVAPPWGGLCDAAPGSFTRPLSPRHRRVFSAVAIPLRAACSALVPAAAPGPYVLCWRNWVRGGVGTGA